MMQQTYSMGFIRKRRLYTALPLLIFPFLTLLFWTLGGGQIDESTAADKPTGFNFKLPDAYLEGKSPLDKLGFYQQAEKDSLRYAELIKNDPYYQGGAAKNSQADTSKLLGLPTKKQTLESNLNTSASSQESSAQEQKVYQKLNQLNAVLNASTDLPAKKFEDEFPRSSTEHTATIDRSDMERLEGMMRGVESGSGQDPELVEINGMLEKILDIQHPERVQHRLKEKSSQQRGQVFPVLSGKIETPISSLENDLGLHFESDFTQNGFYSLDEPSDEPASANAIEAVVHETQQLVNGSTVKLRLINDVYVNGVLIQAGNFLYGTASLDGERLKVSIASFRYQNSLLPVALSVFDLDGLDGIHIPGAISRDAAKQSGEQAIQGFGMTTFDQGIGAQAASAGIELTRNLLSKKVKLVKVTVKAGYQVLLRDQKQVENL
jgi:conjugative transposon TraM protein